MFKTLSIFRIAPECVLSTWKLIDAAELNPHTSCSPTQERSVGWTPPRGEANGALVESVGGQWLMKLMLETKAVPSAVINRKLAERVLKIEAATGRKPGKKECKELKEDIKLELLPMAFARQAAITAWIDPTARLLLIDSTKVDEVLTALSAAIAGLGAVPLQTTLAPWRAMADWLLSQEPPAGFSIDRECELQAADESKAVVQYGRHALDIAEVQQHITQGKLPVKLALTYNGRVSFVLTDKMVLKKITMVGVEIDEDVDRFDGDVAIVTGELRKLIPALVDAMGGTDCMSDLL